VTTELERSPFHVAWWPVDVAIAWILTRDRTFVERHWKRRGSVLGITIAVAAGKHYPRLSTGGVLILDDYGAQAGARWATDEYFAGLNPGILLMRIDENVRALVKPAGHCFGIRSERRLPSLRPRLFASTCRVLLLPSRASYELIGK
jgi:hypothetical protein